MKVKLFADGAVISEMVDCYNDGVVQGFTTNPTLMRQAGIQNYENFAKELTSTLEVEADGLTGFWQQTVNLFDLFGTPMLVGCIPWALIGGWVGYIWTATYLRRRHSLDPDEC